MTAAEWNTFRACELDEAAALAYDAGDYEAAFQLRVEAATRWWVVESFNKEPLRAAA